MLSIIGAVLALKAFRETPEPHHAPIIAAISSARRKKAAAWVSGGF
ncbi:hypothetical protein [uncultured Roseobacter sp.]|nr:hypothetical protein [uncultured Roseobacter sp.]